MTTQEKLTGLDLRAAVAVKVLGWTTKQSEYDFENSVVAPPDVRMATFYFAPDSHPAHCGLFLECVPRYESDIAAAWMVVERMRELGFHPSVRDCGDQREWVFYDFKLGHRREHGWAEDVRDATAICRAALAAVEATE